MTGVDIHVWIFGFLCVAVAVTLVMAAFTEQRRSADAPTGGLRAALITVGGVLWPVLAVGIGQLAVLAVLARRWGPNRSAALATDQPSVGSGRF
jgi:hypothetical protein